MEREGGDDIMYYTDLGYSFVFWEYWSDALVKSSE